MPTIPVTDDTRIDLDVGRITSESTFKKYLKGNALRIVAEHTAAHFLRQPVGAPAVRSLTRGLTFEREGALGSSGATLAIKAGGSLNVTLFTGADEMMVADEWFSTITVPPGQTYVAISFAPTLEATDARETGPLGFGFTAGSSVAVTYAEPFPFGADGPTVGACCRELLARHTLPGDLSDIERLPVGAFASVAGEGTLTVSSIVAMPASPNLLATPSLSVVSRVLDVTAGPAIEASLQAYIAGAYEVRVWKPTEGVLRLGYFRRKDAGWSAEVSTDFGVRATVANKDLFAVLLGALFGKPAVDVQAFVTADLAPAQIEEIQQALKASIDRTLTVGLNASFSSLKRNEAAFEYEITPAQLTGAGRAAVESALDGNLSALHALEQQPAGAAGIRVLRTVFSSMRQRTTTLKVHLFGLVNATSLRDFIRESRVAHDVESGEVVIADRVTSKRLGLVAKTSRVESERLRKVLFESVVATAAYRAGQLVENVGVDLWQQYFEFHRKTDQETMRDNVECLVAVGLLTGEQMEQSLRPALADYGPSTFLLETTLPTEACTDMFLTGSGQPRPIAEYEDVGRQALLAFVPPGSHDDFRRLGATDDALWHRLKKAGSDTAIDGVLAPVLGHSTEGTIKKRIIGGDVTRILWWAESMHEVGTQLAAIRILIAGRDPEALLDDPNFTKQRARLEEALAGMVKHSAARFDDPWGLVALDLASNRKGSARAVVAAPTLSLRRAR